MCFEGFQVKNGISMILWANPYKSRHSGSKTSQERRRSQEDFRPCAATFLARAARFGKASRAISEHLARSARVWNWLPRAATHRPRAAKSKNFSVENPRASSAERDLPRRTTSRRDPYTARREVRESKRGNAFSGAIWAVGSSFVTQSTPKIRGNTLIST